jgi:uncharacterized protein
MRPYTILVLIMGLAMSQSALAAKASFTCNAHSGQAEKLICSNPELAELDVSLANLYRVLMKSLPHAEQQALKTEQRGWIEGRNACSKAADPKVCLKEEYHARINELKDR